MHRKSKSAFMLVALGALGISDRTEWVCLNGLGAPPLIGWRGSGTFPAPAPPGCDLRCITLGSEGISQDLS